MKKFLLVIVSIISINKAFAGFPIGMGKWLLVPQYIRYVATDYWDNDRESFPYQNGGKFTSDYFGLYGGYGMSRNVNFMFKIPYVSNSFQESRPIVGGTENFFDRRGGLQDIQLGLKFFLKNYADERYLSLTASLIFPMYSEIKLPTNPTWKDTIKVNNQLGFASNGGELKLSYAGTDQDKLKDCYWDIEAGVRHYFNSLGPTQLFASATMGVPFDEEWKIAGTLRGVSSNSPVSNLLSRSQATLINRDFDYIRAELALGYRVSRKSSLWGSIFSDISGRNIGQGSGFSIFLVSKF